MKLVKFLIVPSLVIALVGTAVAPSATLAATPIKNEAVTNQVKELSSEELKELSLKLDEIYLKQKFGNKTLSSDEEMSTFGIKSKAELKVADMLIGSGTKTANLLENMGLLDAAAARSFKRVTGKVGNFVDSLASAGDDAAAMARTLLPNKLKSWGITNKDTREMIANSVSYAIKAADWLFL